MKNMHTFAHCGALGLAVVFCAGEVNAAQASATPIRLPAADKAPARAVADPVSAAIPQSVFTVPANAAEGVNPFFPNSRLTPDPLPVKPTTQEVIFVLNGITSPPKRTAMINGRTFEVGEEGEVRLTGGAKALIKCTEIGDSKAIILYNGQRRELRLRAGL
jgi:hypothetical protein